MDVVTSRVVRFVSLSKRFKSVVRGSKNSSMCKCKFFGRDRVLGVGLLVLLALARASSSQAIGSDHPPHSRSLPTSQEDCSDESYCSDILGFRAISELHRQLDDDQDGHVDISESDDFLREELQYKNGGQERQKVFHLNKKHITISDLWESWKKSEVHNWTVEETTHWLAESVDLPQYSQTFMDNAVDGATLPRLASSTQFLSNTLGIRDPIHKRKISVKAMDAVLFGPSKLQRSYVVDGLMIFLVCVATVFCYYYFIQNRHSQSQLHKVMKDLESLHQAQDGLRELQDQLDKATMETNNVTSIKEELEKQLQNTITFKNNENNVDPAQFHQVMEELNRTREQLVQARRQLEAKRWLPPPQLQTWLQLSYELELKNFASKKANAEAEFEIAREGCKKLGMKKSNFLGSFRLAHGNTIDNVDSRILRARSSLTELTQELKERAFRWKKIEEYCGFQICKNPGIDQLGIALNPLIFQHPYAQNSGSENAGEDINTSAMQQFVHATTSVFLPSVLHQPFPTVHWSSGFGDHPTPPRMPPPLLHRDSSNYLYDCISTSANSPVNASGGVHSTCGVRQFANMDGASSEDSLADSSTESTNPPPSLASSGGVNHHPTFTVGDSVSLDDDAMDTDERRPLPISRSAFFQKAKSFSQDPPANDQQDVSNVSKSNSESTLSSCTAPPWVPKSAEVTSAKPRPLIENKVTDTSPLISDEETKDKKKKSKTLFKFKRSKHLH